MMPEEETQIKRFVYCQLRDAPDLSTLTLGILKRRYLAFVGHASFSPEAKNLMKRVVEEELMKMQDSDKDVSESDNFPAVPSQNKRKREKENEETKVVDEDESRAKKSRHQSSSSEVEEKEDCDTGSEESEEEEQIKKTENGDKEQRMKKSQEKTDGISEEDINSEACTEEEINESEKRKQGKILAENNSDGKQKQMGKRRAENEKSGVKRTRNTSEGKKTSPSQRDEDEIDTDSKENGKHDSSEPSEDDSEKEEKVLMEKKNDELVEDSDSSSLPSLEDEQDSGREKTELAKKKTTTKKESENIPKGEKEGHKAVLRLKRYISLCGVRRNYKKLLDGCRSVRSKVAVLKKELEDLGVQGQPSIEKCKKARLIREEAQEVAELDVSNIITTQGRPKRRGASVWQEQHVPPSSTYKPILNSSDSDEDRHTGRGRRRATDWGNLQGIISDDGDSG